MSKKNKRNKNKIPEAVNKQQLQQVIHQMVRTEIFSGPLPSPDNFQKYNEILPGAAERILKMAEQQGSHRRELEKAAITHDIKQSKRGSIFAFSLGVLAIVAGFILLLLGKDIYGLGAMISGIAPILIAFIYQSGKRKKERLQKYGKDAE